VLFKVAFGKSFKKSTELPNKYFPYLEQKVLVILGKRLEGHEALDPAHGHEEQARRRLLQHLPGEEPRVQQLLREEQRVVLHLVLDELLALVRAEQQLQETVGAGGRGAGGASTTWSRRWGRGCGGRR